MSAKRSAEMVKCLGLIAAGMSIRQAARECGLHWSSVHRAINKDKSCQPPKN